MARKKHVAKKAAKKIVTAKEASPKKTTAAHPKLKPKTKPKLKASKNATFAAKSKVMPTTTSEPESEPKPLTPEMQKEHDAKWLTFYDGWMRQRWDELVKDAKALGIMPAQLRTTITSFAYQLKHGDKRDSRVALMHYLKAFYDSVNEHFDKTCDYAHPVALWARPEWRKEAVDDPDSIWVLHAYLQDPGRAYHKDCERGHNAVLWDFGWYMPPVPLAWRDVQTLGGARMADVLDMGGMWYGGSLLEEWMLLRELILWKMTQATA